MKKTKLKQPEMHCDSVMLCYRVDYFIDGRQRVEFFDTPKECADFIRGLQA